MHVIVQNLKVEYDDQGQGPILLMLHGWQDNLHTFEHLANNLSKFFRIIRLDLPGFGLSEHPPRTWTLQDYVGLVVNFTRKINIQPKIILGHSFGGRITVKGVSTKCFSPEKIVLIASAGIAKRNTTRNLSLLIAAKLGKLLIYVPPFIFWKDQIRQKFYSKIGSDYHNAGTLKDIYLKIIQEDLSAYAKNIQVPTLLIWGSRDTQTPLEEGERMAKLIPGARLEIFNSSHFVHQEKPEQLAKLIIDFVKS